ncbi:MAG: type II toxin-antitoxin system PemK/MazF family toxin [bacterium]|nr:type II toxin-antitoxin system PemK/MazF family toxin [bacterium]
MKTGDIYLVNLDPTVGDEKRKTRPVVVLNAGDRASLRLAIVVPITGWQRRWEEHPFFLTIAPEPRHGLRKKSAVDCYQVRALSHRRFIKRLGALSEQEMGHIKTAVALVLDIEPVHCS